MSTCAFCGVQRRFGHHFVAHRLSTWRLRTVKVCQDCLTEAREAGYEIAQRESGWASDADLCTPQPACRAHGASLRTQVSP